MPLPLRFALAPLAAAMAFLVQYLVLPQPSIAPFVFFFFGIALASLLGGLWPGLLAVALSAMTANFWFVPPARMWATSDAALYATVLFVVGAAPIAALCAAFRTATLRSARTAELLGQQARLLDLSQDAIFVWRLGGEIESWNGGAEALFGFTRAEAQGRVTRELLGTVFPDRLPEIEAELLRDGRWEGELVHHRKSGDAITVATRLQLVRGSGGELRVMESTRDITARKQAEQALRRSEQLVHAAFDNAALGIVEADAEGSIVVVNDRICRILGFTQDELIGRSVHDLVAPEDREQARTAIDDVRRTGSGRAEFETRYLRRDGSRTWARVTVTPVGEADGSNTRTIATLEDITAWKRAENRLHRFFESGQIGVYSWAPSGAVNDANDAFLRMTGYDRADLAAGRIDWVAMTPPEWRRADEGALRQIRATGNGPPTEKEFIRKDGTRLPVIVGGAMLDDDRRDGVAFLVDLTERKRAEQALRASEERYRTLFEAIDQGFTIVEVIFDDRQKPVDYRFLEVNPAFERQTGLVAAEGKRMRELAPLHEEYWFEIYGRIARTGEPERFQQRAAQLGRWYDVYAFRVGAADSRQVAILFDDITAARKAEEELRRANLQLEEADRRKDEFLGILSHELRNPLTPIRNGVFVLGRLGACDERASKTLGVIDRQSAHMARLIDDLLDVTRVARGKIRLQRSVFDLADQVAHVAEDHRAGLEASGVRLDVQTPGVPMRVDADPARIAQAIGNLLQNAAKFTPAGGRVTISLRPDDRGRVLVEVADTGVGIDAETLERLFEPFSQADRSLDRSRGGLGLGLALTRGLVALHGGTIEAASGGPGRGARFTIALPLAATAGAEASGPAVTATASCSPRPRRVLVIEDNVDAAESLKDVLEIDGHRVTLAHDGRHGAEVAMLESPDVVLCDIGLPGLDGYGVARALREDPRTSSKLLVALSGYAQPEDVRRAQEAGFDLHLAKPPDLAALERIIAGCDGAAAP